MMNAGHITRRAHAFTEPSDADEDDAHGSDPGRRGALYLADDNFRGPECFQ